MTFVAQFCYNLPPLKMSWRLVIHLNRETNVALIFLIELHNCFCSSNFDLSAQFIIYFNSKAFGLCHMFLSIKCFRLYNSNPWHSIM